jgi:succinate dehydrogenase/fumarate reductase flavoprotein subunit
MENRIIESDILIIGGGSAGCMAAIRALDIDPKLRVVIFDKGDIKYSGAIARGMDALNIVAIPDFTTPEEYVEANTISCHGVLDESPSYEMARRSFELLKKLEKWGVYFPKDIDGGYRTLQFHPKGEFLTAMEEPNLKTIISSKAQKNGAFVINRTMGLRLLTDNGRVAGAVGLNVRNGELVICKASSVIIASGGTARFGLPNSGYLYGGSDYPGNTGDGYVMSYLAGARITGMEQTHRSMLIKDVNIPLLAITINRGGRMLDIFDNILMEGTCHQHEKSIDSFNKGWGPLRIQLSHLPVEKIEEIEHILFTTERPVMERFFSRRNIDFKKNDIELWPTEHKICGGHGLGGIVVNEKAETVIPGLFAAGDAACVSKGHLTGAFVFGEIAAESSVDFAKSNGNADIDSSQIDDIVLTRNRRFTKTNRFIDIRDLEYKMRRLINDYVVSPKNEYKLNRWLSWAKIFENEIENEVAVTNGHDLSKLFEVENILRSANFSAIASLERKESRWNNSHLRTDYPDKDDKEFLCHIDIFKGDCPDDIKVAKRPLNRKTP